jgi:hypothetical protein
MARIKKPVEAAPGKFAALPHVVLDSPAYTGATPTAKALLCELMRQHDGKNNGRFHLAHTWLAARGWPSKSTVEKARGELIERGLIVQTKQGGLFIGPTWYAVTWLTISNFTGLEIGSHQYHPGAWQFCDQPPTTRRKPPMKKISQPVHRGSPAPTSGAVSQRPDPYTGAIKPVSANLPPRTPGTMYITNTPTENSPAQSLPAVERFKARIGGRLTLPARDTSLGRTRHIRLFKAALTSTGAAIPTPAKSGHNHGHTGHPAH